MDLTDRHPTDLELIDWIDDGRPSDATSDHILLCDACAVLVDAADSPIVTRLMQPVGGPRPAIVSPPPGREEPSRGEVWRLRWDRTVLLALIWNVYEDYLEVIPVTPDVLMADESTLKLAAEQTNGLGSIAVWIGLEAPVDRCVLDTFWGEIAIEEVESVRRRLRLGKPIDSVSASIGSPISNAFDERYEYRATVSDDIDTLRSATWIAIPGERTLQELLIHAGTSVNEVAVTIGIPTTERLRILRGHRPFTSAEAHLVAPLLQAEPIEVLATNPTIDPDLVLEMNLPRWKREIIGISESRQLSEAEARNHVAYGVLALAARQTRFESKQMMWRERLNQYFAAK